MKAAGMVPLTLNSAEMKGLVSYLSSLGGKISRLCRGTARFRGVLTCAG